MEDLIQFIPIVNNSPENIKKYYELNNIELPQNKYFTNYINKEIPKINDSGSGENILDRLGSKTYYQGYNPDYMKEKKDEFTNFTSEDKEYLTRLAARESSNRPDVTNQYGYYGLYQFGPAALATVGYTKEDMKNVDNQHKAALKLAGANELILKDILKDYLGKTYKGVKITKNGLRAAAHLLGAGAVKDWFYGTNKSASAKRGFKDANGTSITEYLQMFEK